MGIYKDYVTKTFGPGQLDAERKEQLRRIGQLRNSAVVVYAARMGFTGLALPISILQEDVLPFYDSISELSGPRVSIVIETPGGDGDAARRMVELLRARFDYVEFIIPGMAMSAGTIMALGGNEILMGPASALGPIDAQLISDGKQFSADALIDGFERIKEEVDEKKELNLAWVPILQRISPGELQHAQHALEFAKETVTNWLCAHKFRDWTTHSSTGAPVTDEERRARAREIADTLASQRRWRTHSRSLSIADLTALRLRIIDYSSDTDLNDAIQRYYALLRITLDNSNVFKLFETPIITFARNFQTAAPQPTPGPTPPPPAPPADPQSALLDVRCNQCGANTRVQLDFAPGIHKDPGAVRFPNSGTLSCPGCGRELNLAAARADAERHVGRPALNSQPED